MAQIEAEHPYKWEEGQPFPPEEIFDPPHEVVGLWVGICIYCGGSLGGPYQEDLYHLECDEKASESYLSALNSTCRRRLSMINRLTPTWGWFLFAWLVVVPVLVLRRGFKRVFSREFLLGRS